MALGLLDPLGMNQDDVSTGILPQLAFNDQELMGMNPVFASRINALQELLKAQGLDVGMAGGYRDNNKQAELYAKGRTAPGPIVTNAPPGASYHNYGLAADLMPKGMNEDEAGKTIGQTIRANPDLGLTWGGAFKNLYDPLHVQMAGGLPADNTEFSSQSRMPQQGGVPQQGGGFLSSVSNALNNPLTMFGLALASGRTPQEGMGNAVQAQLAQQKIAQSNLTGDIKNWQFYRSQGGTLPFDAWQKEQANMSKAPQFHTITGLLGEQTPIVFDPVTQTVKPLNGGQGGQGGGTVAPNGPTIEPNYDEKGKDPGFLAQVEKQYGPVVAKSIVDITEGRLPAMGRNLQKLIPLASRYDQNFTGMQDYQSRLQTAKSFASGRDAETVKSYNQAIIHANKAWDLVPKIEGFPVGGVLGKAANLPYGEARAALSPQFASDRKEYENVVNALSGELMKASRGSGQGSLEEIRAWKAGALAANSGAEMRGALRGAMDFLEGAMSASATKKSEGLKSQFEPRDLLTKETRAIFDKISTSTEGDKAAPRATQGQPADSTTLPATAMQHLKEGVPTTFKNGQTWTLQNGNPVRIK